LGVERLEDRTLLSAAAGHPGRLADLLTGNIPARVSLSARVAAYVANDSSSAGQGQQPPGASDAQLQDTSRATGDNSASGDSSEDDDYPVPPPSGPAQRGDVGVQPVSEALLLPLRDGVLTLSATATGPASSTLATGPVTSPPLVPGGLSAADIARPVTPPRASAAGSGEGPVHPGPLALAMLLDVDAARPGREIADVGTPLSADAVAQVLSAAAAKSGAADQLRVADQSGTLTSRAPQGPKTPAPAGETAPGDAAATATPAVPPETGQAVPFSVGVLLRRLAPLLLVIDLGLAWKVRCDGRRRTPEQKHG
jgi:hypothetical protein